MLKYYSGENLRDCIVNYDIVFEGCMGRNKNDELITLENMKIFGLNLSYMLKRMVLWSDILSYFSSELM